MNDTLTQFLTPFARRYIWWKKPDEAMLFPERVIAAVLDHGDWNDALALEKHLGGPVLKQTLQNAATGEFRPKSWHFWHKRLYGVDVEVPVQSGRTFT